MGIFRRQVIFDEAIVSLQRESVIIPMNRHGQGITYEKPIDTSPFPRFRGDI
jgi:hypothetical protein